MPRYFWLNGGHCVLKIVEAPDDVTFPQRGLKLFPPLGTWRGRQSSYWSLPLVPPAPGAWLSRVLRGGPAALSVPAVRQVLNSHLGFLCTVKLRWTALLCRRPQLSFWASCPLADAATVLRLCVWSPSGLQCPCAVERPPTALPVSVPPAVVVRWEKPNFSFLAVLRLTDAAEASSYDLFGVFCAWESYAF